MISNHVFRLAPTTKIMPFLESLKKQLSKNVYVYYGRVYTSEVVSFAGAGVKMEEQFTNFEAKWGRRRTNRCSAAGTGVGEPESFMN